MEGLFVPVVLTSLTTSAVLLPLLLLSTRLQNRYVGRTLYVVWLVLALRLAVPVDISLPQTPVQVATPDDTVPWPAYQRPLSAAQTLEPLQDTPEREVAASVELETAAAVSLVELAAAVWLGGMLWLLLVRGSSYFFTRRALLRLSRPADGETVAQAAALCAELSLRRPVPVRFHPGLSSPLTLGIIKPVILLPVGEVPEGALRHELCHIRRKDLLYQLLLLWVTMVHWFNPLVWWMSRVARRNLEFCCDDDVVRGRDAAFRRQYGELLLTTAAETDGPVLSTRFGGSAAEMKRRLSNLFTRKKKSAALTVAVLLGVLLVGVLVACESQSDVPAPPDALLDALQESITYDGQTVAFTLPEGETIWSLHIAGRMEAEGMGGMSLHYLDETDWQPGQSYSFELEPETASALTELTMDVTAGEEERSIDLLSVLSIQTGTESGSFSISLEDIPPYTPPRSSTDAVPSDTMGEIILETVLSDGSDVVCYWEPGSAYTKYWAIRRGEELWRFCTEESGYHGIYGVSEYQDVFGHDGFCISGPRGASYYFIDYYYLDENGIPQLLVDCATQVLEQDWNGDGEKELLWTYHQFEGYYCFRRGEELYLCSLNERIQAARPEWTEIFILWEAAEESDQALHFTYQKDGKRHLLSVSISETQFLVTEET